MAFANDKDALHRVFFCCLRLDLGTRWNASSIDSTSELLKGLIKSG